MTNYNYADELRIIRNEFDKLAEITGWSAAGLRAFTDGWFKQMPELRAQREKSRAFWTKTRRRSKGWK